jgi:hypothetical protein
MAINTRFDEQVKIQFIELNKSVMLFCCLPSQMRNKRLKLVLILGKTRLIKSIIGKVKLSIVPLRFPAFITGITQKGFDEKKVTITKARITANKG